jgi:hypothetical protein
VSKKSSPVQSIDVKKTILVKQALPCQFELPETGREAPILPAQKYYLKIYNRLNRNGWDSTP